MTVRVLSPDPAWPVSFLLEAERIRSALGGHGFELHHIGSTAIAGIFAKPIIDMLLVAPQLQWLEEVSPALTQLGYEAMGEFGIPGRRYFRKTSSEGIRTHHLHAFVAGSADVQRHLAFRDYMNAHPLAARSYSELKRNLAAAHPDDMGAYVDGKNAFIKAHELKALAWALALLAPED